MSKVVLVIRLKKYVIKTSNLPDFRSDLQKLHGIDIEKEMMAALNYELTVTLDNEILNSMFNISSKYLPLHRYEFLINDERINKRGLYYG